MVSIYPDPLNNSFLSEIRKGQLATPNESSQKQTHTHSFCQRLFDNGPTLFFSSPVSLKRKVTHRKNSRSIFPLEIHLNANRRSTLIRGMPDYRFNLPSESQRTLSLGISGSFSENKAEK